MILLNQFEKSTGFYKLVAAEENVRVVATSCTNAYFITLFACQREVLIRNVHSGGFTAELAEEARLKYERGKKMQAMGM